MTNSFKAWEITKEGITPWNIEEKLQSYLSENSKENDITPIRLAAKQFYKDNLINTDQYNFFTKTNIETLIEIFL